MCFFQNKIKYILLDQVLNIEVFIQAWIHIVVLQVVTSYSLIGGTVYEENTTLVFTYREDNKCNTCRNFDVASSYIAAKIGRQNYTLGTSIET